MTDRQQPQALWDASSFETDDAYLPLATSSLHTCHTWLNPSTMNPQKRHKKDR